MFSSIVLIVNLIDMKFDLNLCALLILTLNISFLVHVKSDTTCIQGKEASKLNEKFLNDHNEFRRLHGVPPLTADPDLIEESIKWSKHLADTNSFEHSKGSSYGENLYVGGPIDDESNLKPVHSWYDEIEQYKKLGFSQGTGHFTQVGWKNSKKLGCGVCTNSDRIAYVTCRYTPPGNIIGQFEENVPPLLSITVKEDSSTGTIGKTGKTGTIGTTGTYGTIGTIGTIGTDKDTNDLVQKLIYIMSFVVLLIHLPLILMVVVIIYSYLNNPCVCS